MAGHSRLKDGVASARLCPAIHAFLAALRTWMPGTSPGMTKQQMSVAIHDQTYGISYTTILSAMPRSAACFWIGLIDSFARIAATAGESITGPVM
jgi:hypothetical protein